MGDVDYAAKEKESVSLLSRKQYVEALQCVLETPPFNAKDQSVKDNYAASVFKALSSVPDAEIEKTVTGLWKTGNSDICDNLMKYIYRGLEQATFSGVLLKWHAIVVDVAGQGTIVRALADRKTV